MTPVALLWISLACCVLGLVALVAFLATGRRNAPLRVAGGLLVIVGLVAGFLAR